MTGEAARFGPQSRLWARRALATLQRFAGWWLGEIYAILPGRLTSRMLGDGETIFIRLADGQAHLDLPGKTTASFPIGGARLEPGLRRLVERADAIAILLPAASVLRRIVTIPAVAPRQLHAAIPFLVERHTPFPQAQARAAWRILARDHIGRTMRVELAVTASAPLANTMAALQAMKLPVSKILVQADDGSPRLDFHAQDRFGGGRFWLREPSRILLAASLLLLLVGPIVVALATHIQARRAAATAASIGGTQNGLAVLARLQTDMAQNAVLAVHLDSPAALATLDAVTHALSDETWLFNFELSGTTLELQGFTANLPAMVAQLQSLRGLDRLEFKSPVMHGIRDNKDRFDILLRLKKADHAERLSPQPASGIAAAGRGDLVGLGLH